MRIPAFVKEVVWACYPPRYKQLAEKPFGQSLKYMSKILLIAFIISGILFLPKLFTLKDTIQEELSKFESFQLDGNISQTAPITIPRHNPWIVVDLNANLSMTKEALVIDQNTVKYRFFGIKSIPRNELKNMETSSAGFFTAMLLLMLPGILLLLYIRMWVKYFLIILVVGTLFFIIMELSRFRLRWKQMLNITTHALTAVILIEVIAAAVNANFLLPIFRFVGVNVYLITLAVLIVLMILGIVGYQFGARHRR